MFDHVTIRVSDPDASDRFYDVALGAIGLHKTASVSIGDGCPEYGEWDDFSLAPGDEPTTGLHVAFATASRAAVDAFWRAGVDAGYRSDGEPGLRPHYRPDYYGAFLLDPDGNSVEAVHHGGVGSEGKIDHLWIRVPDRAATQAFYAAVAQHTGFPLLWDEPERVHFGALGGHFALVEGRPVTRNLHLAFPASSNDQVDAFYAAAIEAGYTGNGEPGERPQYHAGYYGAFVLDPAGANVEVVCHNRDR